MTQNEEIYIPISRCKLLKKFIHRLYHQKNVNKICKGDLMIVPISKLNEWMHDMGLILGKSIEDTIEEMADEES